MITPLLIGRFGNQVFQVCAAIAYALEHNMPYHIPVQTQNAKIWPPAFRHLVNPYFTQQISFEIKEQQHTYRPLPYNPHFTGNIVLNGYWQSEKYFKKHLPALRELLFPGKLVYNEGKQVDKICSIHVRRGDYLTFADKHPPVTLGYLREAIKHLNAHHVNRFMVFSDDMQWCRNHVNHNSFPGNHFQYSEPAEGEAPATDWLRMANCTHNIISNSSYSLTAAIFNPNPDKIIVAPAQWFGPGNAHLETEDMYPENCVIL